MTNATNKPSELVKILQDIALNLSYMLDKNTVEGMSESMVKSEKQFDAALAPILAAMKAYDHGHIGPCSYFDYPSKCTCGYSAFKAAIAKLEQKP